MIQEKENLVCYYKIQLPKLELDNNLCQKSEWVCTEGHLQIT